MKTLKVEIIEPKVLSILEALQDLELINIKELGISEKLYKSEPLPQVEAQERAVQYETSNIDVTNSDIKNWLNDIRGRFLDLTEEELNAEIAEAQNGTKN